MHNSAEEFNGVSPELRVLVNQKDAFVRSEGMVQENYWISEKPKAVLSFAKVLRPISRSCLSPDRRLIALAQISEVSPASRRPRLTF